MFSEVNQFLSDFDNCFINKSRFYCLPKVNFTLRELVATEARDCLKFRNKHSICFQFIPHHHNCLMYSQFYLCSTWYTGRIHMETLFDTFQLKGFRSDVTNKTFWETFRKSVITFTYHSYALIVESFQKRLGDAFSIKRFI